MNICAAVALGASTTDSAASPPRLSPRQHCMNFFEGRKCLNLDSGYLSGVNGGQLVQLRPWSKSKHNLAIASVYLPPSSSTLRWSCTRRKASTPRLRLGVLAFLLVQLQLKSPLSKSKSTSAIASVDLDLDSGDLSGVSGWAPRATSAQVPLVKSTPPLSRTYTRSWCLVDNLKMKFDQNLCKHCDMNSTLGSVMPLANSFHKDPSDLEK